MDDDGKTKKLHRAPTIFHFTSGWSEQNPADWYEQSIDGLKELLAECDKAGGRTFGDRWLVWQTLMSGMK